MPIKEQATVWVLRMISHTELDDTEALEFHSWLRGDPRHVAEYRAQFAIAQYSRDLSADVRLRLRARGRQRSAFGRAISPPGLALAASALALILVFIGLGIREHARPGPPRAAVYSTKTAETRSIRLSDTSIIELNSRTRLEWHLTDRDRLVDLLEGEVYVDVARDTHRPFRVRIGQSEIRAIGTRFDVYRKSADTVVLTLVEGTVEVAEHEAGKSTAKWIQRVSAPRTIEYQLNGVTRQSDDSTEVLRWREGRVNFKERPLAEAVEELQRYTDRRVVFDQRLASARVGGLYSTWDVTGDFTSMAQYLPMTVQDDGDVISLNFRERNDSHRR